QWLNQFAGHPLAQQIREWASRFGVNTTGPGPRSRGPGPDFAADDESSFTPPADIFATDKAYVLHFALPGAKKDDIGVDWNAEKGELRVAGVVYRPGDEDFLATMTSSERRVGMFSRSVPLPPAGSAREEIDAPSITAKMEDGILIVTVPKLEKEWTEIHKVDIK
ncbi:HSP20-like chaperone, partial [Colletotrichum zoysiae]